MRLKILLAIVVVLACVISCHGQTVVAHRGSSHIAPENTLSAFRLAWDQGADAIEGDFYLTADKKIVCLHDKTTARTAPGQPVLAAATSSLAELKKLDVGVWKAKEFAGETIPTMTEVLETVPVGKQIFVEIKCGVEIVPHLAEVLSASKIETEQIVIISFHKEVVRSIRQTLPQYDCNWLTGYSDKNVDKHWRPTRKQVSETLIDLGATGVGSQFNRKVVDAAFVDSVHSSGREFHVWTVNQPAEIKAAFAMNVDSLTTDCPDVAVGIRNQIRIGSKVELEEAETSVSGK